MVKKKSGEVGGISGVKKNKMSFFWQFFRTSFVYQINQCLKLAKVELIS